MSDLEVRIGGSDIASAGRVWFNKGQRRRRAGGNIKAVLPRAGRDFEDIGALECDGRQPKRTIKRIPTVKMRSDIIRAIGDRGNAMLNIVAEMAFA
ncbi:MAG: hypothetical protein WBF12_07395, partial [Bradyrhizobium sp.]